MEGGDGADRPRLLLQKPEQAHRQAPPLSGGQSQKAQGGFSLCPQLLPQSDGRGSEKKLAVDEFESFSAGTEPDAQINPDAVRLMKQVYGILHCLFDRCRGGVPIGQVKER